jgi:hypothetical protein
MRRTTTLAVLAVMAASLAAGACDRPAPTESRTQATVRHDEDPPGGETPPPDTTLKCTNGMIGSGTRC